MIDLIVYLAAGFIVVYGYTDFNKTMEKDVKLTYLEWVVFIAIWPLFIFFWHQEMVNDEKN